MVVRGRTDPRRGRQYRSGARSVALGLLLILLLTALSPSAAAQVPDAPDSGNPRDYLVVDLSIAPGEGYKKVKPGQQVRYQIEVTDASADNTYQAGRADNPLVHMVQVFATIIEPQGPKGWSVSVANNTLFTEPGQTVESTIIANALFAAEDNYVTILVNATLTGPDGQETWDELILMTQLEPYYAGQAFIRSSPATAGPFETIDYQLEIVNQATYPDWFSIHVNATEGFEVRHPAKVYLEPFQSRIVNLTIQTPHDSMLELGRMALFEITIRSQSDPGFQYTTSATMKLQGMYVSGYQLPLLTFLLMAVGMVTQKSVQKSREAHARKGKPRPVRVSPRQEVLLAELKRRDKDAYRQKVAQLNAVYGARKKKYRTARRIEKQEERTLRKEQRAAAKLQRKERKKEQKLARKEERRLEKERRKERKAQAKVDRKAAKAQAKIDKKQRKIDKKAAKKQAKVDKKEAKVRAKQEKKLRRQLKKKERSLQKAKRKTEGGGGLAKLFRRKKE